MKWHVHDQAEPPTVAPSRPADIGASSTLPTHVVAAARRVQRAHRLRMLDEVSAFHAWQYNPTLSNAIRRDDTRKDLLELADANTLAIAILSQFEAESKAWHDANPVDTYA